MENLKSENKTFIFPIVLVLFFIALFLRLVKAEAIPFTRADADLAWQALEISKLQNSGTSPLALYTGFTGLFFWISSVSDLFARLLPALMGSSLVLVPYVILSRKYSTSLIGLSLLIALDPILVIYSRQIYGPILAISTVAWTMVFLYKNKPIVAGILFGMALLAGKYFWLATLLFSIYLLLNFLFDKKRFLETIKLFEKPSSKFLISTVLSSVLISSSFLLNPSGLTGIASGLVDLFAFSSSTSLPLGLPLFLLLTYSLFLLLPFGRAIIHSPKHSKRINLAFQFGLLLLASLFQNQLPGLYAFVELFLIITIARNLEILGSTQSKITLVSLVSFIFFTVILIFTLLSFTQLTRIVLEKINFITDLLRILLALVLILISYLLIGLGWGFDQTKPALQAAILLIAIFFSMGFTLSQTWSDATTSQLLFTNSEILFPDSPMENELSVFLKNKTLNPSIDTYRVENFSSRGENWEFKAFYDSTETSSVPAFIINDSVTESGMKAAYRGTTIVAARRQNFSNKAFAELLQMISSKTLPVSDINKTLWVQTALFPGGK